MPKFLRPAAPRLIRSHPLAVGLADAVLLDGDRGWNYANEGLQPAFAGAMTAEWTGESPGSRANGTSSNYATLASTYNIAAGAFTVSVLWKPVSHSLQFVTMLEKANGTSREWAFFVRYNGSNGNVSFYTIGTTNSGDVNLATAMTDGGTYRFTATRDTSNTITMYVNGVPRATGSSAGTTAVSGSAWQIGRRVSGATSPNAVYGDLFVWPGRCLSADEVMQHAADPWEMLRPVRRLFKPSFPPLTATIAGDIPITAAIAAELTPLSGGVPHGVLRRGRRGRVWQDVPEELKPVVALAEEWSEADPVARAVEEALAKHARITLRTSAARRARLIDEAKRAVIAAVERAAEMDDEEALIALL